MRDYSFLLERPEWKFPDGRIVDFFSQKRVMVTGAGGSIGSAVCGRLLSGGVKFLGAVGNSEYPMFRLKSGIPAGLANVEFKIADVRRPMENIFSEWRPDIVIHAAAHKHVGLMEAQPQEAFDNNVAGTINVALTAKKFGVGEFVFVSTDKAANPSSVMGASKKLAEYWLMSHIRDATVVRFGNVMGSSGSLIEILERQIKDESPVMITHRDMKRYFITIREAVGLILTTASCCKPGVYSLDMGKQISISSVVEKLFEKNNSRVRTVQFGTPGEGEKLEEEILNPAERMWLVPGHPGILSILGSYFPECWDLAVSRFQAGEISMVEAANKI